ncbi:hypothetical protein [Clostridium paraputrificum]|uniref:Uncharacterized protein n=1 Tax=Clostridium paraputrificum TaxID=29363 RepID=A0A6N3GWZ8_9CLOT
MEFRLNKIDTDIRRKLAKGVKEKEVNGKTRPEIDNKVKKPFVELDTEDKNDRNRSKKYITVEGTLESTKKITINAEKDENYIEEVPIGNVIDSVK